MAIHWKRLLTLISLFLMAGCSSGNDIVGDIGTAIQAELLAQATSVADPPIAPTPTLQNDNETEVVALLEQADALEASGEFAAALALVDEAAILAPNSAKVHWMRGRFLYRLNDLQAALAAYDVAVQLGMDWPSGYLTLANLCATMGNTTTELAALNKTIDLSLAQGDGKADSVLMLALQYRSELWARAGDLPAAIADLEASLSIAPWEYGNFITLNELHHRLTARQAAFTEDPVALLADLNDRLGNHPADAQSLLDRGHLTLQLAFIDGDVSNLNSAYQDFTLALSIEPTLAEAYHGRGLVTWLASDDDADVSGMDVEEILALAEIVSTVNLQVADATVTISGGMVTMTNTHSGAVTVQSVDEWRVAHVKLPVMAGATQEAALADLDMALSLAPNLVAARHDRGVIRLRAWFNDGLISMLNEGPPDSPDEALAAAVSDLNFAAQQSPDWAVARFNRGVARLFQGVSLLGAYTNNDGDEEIGEAVLRSFDEAIADASWLVDQDATSGWAYFVRALGIRILQSVMGEIDPTLATSLETDERRIFELIPNFNTDEAILQLAERVNVSLHIAPAPLITSGTLEFSDEDLFYTNADYGLRLKTPVRVPDSNVAAAVVNDTLWLHMSDGFRVFNVLVMQPTLKDQTVEMWLADTLLSLTPPGKLVEQPPLQTQYGPATLFAYHGRIESVNAILPIGNYLFSFEYSPGPSEGEWTTSDFGFETRPLDAVLAEFIYGLTVDGVTGEQSVHPSLKGIQSEEFQKRGWDARLSGDYEEAVRLFKLAIDRTPNDAVALNNLAWTLAYDLQIELDAALSYALRAVKFRSTASHYDTLGMVYYRLERYHKAVEAYTEALKLDPSMSTTLLQRADSYIELGDTYEAIQDLERYLDVEPNAENVEEIRSRLDALRNQ